MGLSSIFLTTSECDKCVRWPQDPDSTFGTKKGINGNYMFGIWDIKNKKCYAYENQSGVDGIEASGIKDWDNNKSNYVTVGKDRFWDGTIWRETISDNYGDLENVDKNGENNKKYCNAKRRLKTIWIVVFVLLLLVILFFIFKTLKNKKGKTNMIPSNLNNMYPNNF
jgi:hypothetical protein